MSNNHPMLRKPSKTVTALKERKEREKEPDPEQAEALAAEERRERQNAAVMHQLELLDTLKRIALALEVSAGLTERPKAEKAKG